MFDIAAVLITKLLTHPFFWILLVVGILGNIYYKKFRGYMGEFWVKKELNKLPKEKYFVLNNIMIKKSSIRTKSRKVKT